jgi:tetratricopeptide (TPR) repeat protein
MRPNPRLSIVLMVVVLVVVASRASADRWYEHYARAEAALEREDNQTAIEELTSALERRGDSGARVRTYGMRATAYFPYLKLGIAYLQAAEYDAALRAFDTEERLGAIQESEQASAKLARYRQLAADALERRRVDERHAFDDIVLQNLEEARTLQSEGRLGDALAAVGRALSLIPEDPAANELASALRNELNRQNEVTVHRERSSQLIEEGTRLRSAGQLAEAASRFRQRVCRAL